MLAAISNKKLRRGEIFEANLSISSALFVANEIYKILGAEIICHIGGNEILQIKISFPRSNIEYKYIEK